jgi:hypothetical protein
LKKNHEFLKNIEKYAKLSESLAPGRKVTNFQFAAVFGHFRLAQLAKKQGKKYGPDFCPSRLPPGKNAQPHLKSGL